MWRVFSASVAGQRNLEQGAAGDDACHWLVTDEWLVAIVCDGAGSVREGRAGADFTTRALVEELATTVIAGADQALDTLVRRGIDRVRSRLADVALSRELPLAEFSCTLVGCVASSKGGYFFHVGDGFAIQQNAAGDCVLSAPENGEFADETYFVTDGNWHEHLRLTPLLPDGSGSLIGLMSDGTAPFAIDRARHGFSRPFIDPIAAYLREVSPEIGSEALRNLLQSPRASDISSDDKTLLLAFESDS